MKMNRVPDKEVKFKKNYTVKTWNELTEDKGKAPEVIVLIDDSDKRELIKLVKKDGKLLQCVATTDAQDSGLLADLAKKHGIKEEDLIYTQPSMNTAAGGVKSHEAQGDMGEDNTPIGKDENKKERPKDKAKLGKSSLEKSDMDLFKSVAGILAKGDVVDLGKFKKKKLEAGDEAKITPSKISRPSDEDFGDRIHRIRASLEKINNLMKELKTDKENGKKPIAVIGKPEDTEKSYHLGKDNVVDKANHPYPNHPLRFGKKDASQMSPEENASAATHYMAMHDKHKNPNIKQEFMKMAQYHQKAIGSGHRWRVTKSDMGLFKSLSGILAKGDVIDLGKFKKKKLEAEAPKPVFTSQRDGKPQHSSEDFNDRIHRIKASLEKINNLMAELKTDTANKENGKKPIAVISKPEDTEKSQSLKKDNKPHPKNSPEVLAKGDLISLGKFKAKKEAENQTNPLVSHRDGKPKSFNRPSSEDFNDRIHRIKASLEKINNLMAELKTDTAADKENSKKLTVFSKPEDTEKSQSLKKDNKPHPKNSPEDHAHDVVEEGKKMTVAVKDSGKEIAEMLSHLRQFKKHGETWKRNEKNKKVGKTAPLEKDDLANRRNKPKPKTEGGGESNLRDVMAANKEKAARQKAEAHKRRQEYADHISRGGAPKLRPGIGVGPEIGPGKQRESYHKQKIEEAKRKQQSGVSSQEQEKRQKAAAAARRAKEAMAQLHWRTGVDPEAKPVESDIKRHNQAKLKRRKDKSAERVSSISDEGGEVIRPKFGKSGESDKPMESQIREKYGLTKAVPQPPGQRRWSKHFFHRLLDFKDQHKLHRPHLGEDEMQMSKADDWEDITPAIKPKQSNDGTLDYSKINKPKNQEVGAKTINYSKLKQPATQSRWKSEAQEKRNAAQSKLDAQAKTPNAVETIQQRQKKRMGKSDYAVAQKLMKSMDKKWVL